MGKRKSSAKPPPKKQRPKLAATFNCPFCNSSNSVACTLDRERGAGTVTCAVCGVGFSTEIDSLTEPIDIYSEWIDECEREREEAARPAREHETAPELQDDDAD